MRLRAAHCVRAALVAAGGMLLLGCSNETAAPFRPYPDWSGQWARIGSLNWEPDGYEKAGAPPLKLRGRSTARYRGEVIVELVDEYPDGMSEETERWVRDHAPELDASYV